MAIVWMHRKLKGKRSATIMNIFCFKNRRNWVWNKMQMVRFGRIVSYCLVDKSSLKCIMESDNINELVEDAIIDTM